MTNKLIALKIFTANFLGLMVTYMASFFTPLAPWLIMVGAFVVADFITGVFKAKKQGLKIESKKMFRTIPKFIAYGLAIVISKILADLFFGDFPAVKMIAGFIAFIELKSLDENIKALTGHSLFGDLIKMLNPKRNKQEDQSNTNEKRE